MSPGWYVVTFFLSLDGSAQHFQIDIDPTYTSEKTCKQDYDVTRGPHIEPATEATSAMLAIPVCVHIDPPLRQLTAPPRK